MRLEWKPETPEEIAEHQRMRKELIECRQMYGTKQPENASETNGGFSLLVTLAVVVVFIYFLFIRS